MTDVQRPLRRSRTNQELGGVLAGIAAYFDLNPTRVRVAYAVLTLFSGVAPGVLLYFVLYLIIPEDEREEEGSRFG